MSIYASLQIAAGPVIVPRKAGLGRSNHWASSRSQPIVNDAYWIDQIILMPGTRLTASVHRRLTLETLPWQRIRAGDGREGYVPTAMKIDIPERTETTAQAGEPVTTSVTIHDLTCARPPTRRPGSCGR